MKNFLKSDVNTEYGELGVIEVDGSSHVMSGSALIPAPITTYNLTTSQPHNLTTSQPHNLTTS